MQNVLPLTHKCILKKEAEAIVENLFQTFDHVPVWMTLKKNQRKKTAQQSHFLPCYKDIIQRISHKNSKTKIGHATL